MVFKDIVVIAASKRLALKIIGCKKVSSPRVYCGHCLIVVVRSPAHPEPTQ